MEQHELDDETDEDELVRRIRGGDQTALATMFDRHRGRLEKDGPDTAGWQAARADRPRGRAPGGVR